MSKLGLGDLQEPTCGTLDAVDEVSGGVCELVVNSNSWSSVDEEVQDPVACSHELVHMRRFRGDADVELGAAIDEHEGEKKGGGNCHKCEHTATKKSIRRIYKQF